MDIKLWLSNDCQKKWPNMDGIVQRNVGGNETKRKRKLLRWKWKADTMVFVHRLNAHRVYRIYLFSIPFCSRVHTQSAYKNNNNSSSSSEIEIVAAETLQTSPPSIPTIYQANTVISFYLLSMLLYICYVKHSSWIPRPQVTWHIETSPPHSQIGLWSLFQTQRITSKLYEHCSVKFVWISVMVLTDWMAWSLIVMKGSELPSTWTWICFKFQPARQS